MKPVTIANTFQNQTGPIPLSQLDADLAALAATVNDLATYSNYLLDLSGIANVITLATPAGLSFSYSAGMMIQAQIANTNTSATVNVNVNGLGNQPLTNPGGTILAIGQLTAGQIVQMMYDGTKFQLMAGVNALLFAAGSAVNPSMAFQAYPNTGFYNAGSNAIGVSVAGTQTLLIDAFGRWTINTPTTPGRSLVINSGGSSGYGGLQINAGDVAFSFALEILDATGTSQYLVVYGDGGMVVGAPAGGSKGPGTINVQGGLYLNGVLYTSP